MQRQKGWQTAGVLGMMLLSVASMPPLPTLVGQAQIQPVTPPNACSEQPGQTFERLTRDLIYRSQRYIRDRQFNLAVRSLDRALQTVTTVKDPFSKTDLVASIAGQSGEQPSTLEQLVQQATTPQQRATLLDLLSKVTKATQTLAGEYGVINTKRAILVQLAAYYTVLEQPDQARSRLDQARQLLKSLQGDGFGLIASPVAQGYTTLGDTQTAIALLDQAVQRTQMMKTNNLDYLADIFSTIAVAYASAGSEAKAVQTTQQIKVATIKARTLAQIAKQAAQTGSPQATRILAQAQAQTKAIPAASRSDALSQIALTYGYLKEWDLALKAIAPIQSAEIKIQTLADLASISDRLNHPANEAKPLSELVTIARKMSFYDSDTLIRKIFAQYLANGQYGLAEILHQFQQGVAKEGKI
ncbi:MAG TPA: tetratricopeptide repeat protein [Leptolyngbyaceae cyanobacterium M33_DOE_097]|uniref:Tetratricopeptide repeat protein n=1 Tax=Oscillatoriales cyanobacterium SpSt-418 TaxID=2282169 RepID=A0A7C3KCX6_9CYAN|nr:tetratricopeptide repeat protein [Leptolyngbyaceae cyanobacterium M33_DOE_097]